MSEAVRISVDEARAHVEGGVNAWREAGYPVL